MKIRKEGLQKGLIIKSDKAHESFTLDFMHRMYTDEGKGIFTVKQNIIGEIQEGSRPSAFDRISGTKMGVRCADEMFSFINESQDPSENCVLLGVQKRSTEFTPIQELKNKVDYKHQIPKELWWLKLRRLLRILAKHDSVYTVEGMDMGIE
jgi:6-phosphofructokinase 1